MILDDPKNRPWVVVVSALAVAAIAWYSAECWRAGRLLGGSSRPGLAFGVAGGLICLSEMLIWPRKALRRWGQALRLGGVQHWMRAHVWLGLLSLPLLVMHGGVYPWGGTLSTLLMGLFLAVIASGIWGLAMQQYLPRRLLRDVPGETVYSQIGLVRAQLRDEAAQLVRAACGRSPEAAVPATPSFRIAGKPRPGTTVVEVDPLADPGPLVDDFARVIAPFLCPEPVYSYYLAPSGRPPRPDGSARSPLGDPGRARLVFDDLRSRLDPGAAPVVDALERLCEHGRQLDRQARIHVWLHNWLAVHLPLSVAMIVLMVVHAVAALDYL
jgi:hypothetical protein